MQIWSVNLVLPWCNLLPRIAVHFSLFFFKFAEWAGVCRTRKCSRKRITRTSLGYNPIITIIIIIIIIKVQATEVSCWALKRRVKNRIPC